MPVNVAALQGPQAWGDVPGALDRLRHSLRELKDVDLLLIPEAGFTGYVSPRGDFDLRRFAEPLEGPTAGAVAALATGHRLAIAAPLIEREGDRFFNALLLFDAEGRRIGHWRKRHPWIPETWATPGDLGAPVVEWRGLRVTAAICYDLHFLDEAAAELDRSDVLLFPSAWVEEGPDTRVPKLQSLARRFDLTVVNANWAAGDSRVSGQGGSVIVGPDGRLLARARGAGAETLVASVG